MQKGSLICDAIHVIFRNPLTWRADNTGSYTGTNSGLTQPSNDIRRLIMVKQPNIINFDICRKPATNITKIALPQMVISAQRRSKHHLKVLLPKFFSQLDDRLFELAEKADNNQEQTLYFDAMREMRLQQDEMQICFFRAFEQGFHTSLNTEKNQAADNLCLSNASLIGDEQLEISLAINNMADNAQSLYRETLYGLIARLDFLIEDIEITKTNNPLRPEIICEAFAQTAESMTADIKIKLITYKLFEKSVLQNLGDMYQAINADFIAAGVLPRIKSTIVKSESDATSRRYPTPTSQPASDTEQNSEVHVYQTNLAQDLGINHDGELFSALQQLLHSQRNLPTSNQQQGTAADTINTTNTTNNPATTSESHYQSQYVLSALSQLQTNQDLSFLDSPLQSSAAIIKTMLVDAIKHQADTSVTGEINPLDTDTIDIVSMLFDYILDDPSLSNHIKAQIARLQIPLLKVAIQDKSFFSQKTHPARQLLNELAYASSGLNETDIENDTVYQMVQHVVERILNEYDQDTQVFSTLLQEFNTFTAKERESNRQAEEMLVEARETVAQEIQHRISNNRIAPLVNHILMTAWKEVLIHLYLRDGNQSTGWNTALQVADDLIWSVQPKLLVSERQRLIKIIPQVLNGLRDGLTLIRYDSDASEQIFSGLEALHLSSIRGGNIETETSDNTADPLLSQPMPSKPISTKPVLNDDDFGIDISTLPEAGENDFTNSEYDNILEEIVLASTQPWEESTDSSMVNAEIRDMALGTWVEFIDPETECRKRGKLAWKCDFTGDYTFVDRKFKVIADLRYRKLVEEFNLGRASIVEDVPLFDRALDSVIGGIKQALNRNSESLH